MKFLKKKILFPIYFLASCLFLLTCQKDFSIISENREPFPVIYGLLDVNESVHYVKIYKSYLTDGNAYDLTKDIYKYSYIDSIEVYLIEYDKQGNILRKIPFDTTTSIPKDSGLFGYPMQIIYKVHAILSLDNLYSLQIYNPYTKNIAETKEPIALAHPPRVVELGKYIDITDDSKEFYFFSSKNTTKYSLQIKYFYIEKLLDNTSYQPESIIWVLGNIDNNYAIEGTRKVLKKITGASFFLEIFYNVKEDPNICCRYTDSILYEVYASAKDWDLYNRSSAPSTGVNRETLYYSNMKSYNIDTKEERLVMGFFSSRTKSVKHYSDLGYGRDSLFYGRFTRHLNFTIKK